jgi:hypothetical protein
MDLSFLLFYFVSQTAAFAVSNNRSIFSYFLSLFFKNRRI